MANLAAIRLSRVLDEEARPATEVERAVLAQWSSWGALPQVFDEDNREWATQREELRTVLDEQQWDAARRTTINAHYTDPTYAEAIWETLTALGFEQGRVLEPGSGSGTFIGTAPQGAEMVGVELDPVTAGIARGLYPHAEIRAESFAATRFPDGYFDATVGNVPFANIRLHDPAHNASNHSMHNHFIIKSLALTRPGGVVAVLTSSFTMDSLDTSARREINATADLVGAVRLPTGAHRRTAGTDAVTDLLILRKRLPGEPKRDVSWETLTAIGIDGEPVKINTYFHTHQENILGDLSLGHGMYGAQTLTVTAEDLSTVGTRLQDRLQSIVAEAHKQGLTLASVDPATQIQRSDVLAPQEQQWDGSIIETEQGVFKQVKNGLLHSFDVPKTRTTELSALLGLRDRARALLELEAGTQEATTPDITAARSDLRNAWGSYIDRYGPINRFTWRRTGRYEKVYDDAGKPALDDHGEPVRGDEILARQMPPVMRHLRDEPFFPLIKSLERFDEESQEASPASLLTERVLAPRSSAEVAETPAEALAVSLNETGGVDLERISALLGVEADVARAQLGTLVYDDPQTETLIHGPEYLSGNVREKLDLARAASRNDDRYAVNVAALEGVQPEPVEIADIKARLGAVWISPADHEQFLQELLDDRRVRVENPLPGEWKVTGGRHGVKAITEWGTDRRSTGEIAQNLMNQTPLVVKDTIEDADGKRRDIVNAVETDAAQAKAEALQDRFEEWVWEDPERATRLADEYNRRFNSIRLRDYSQAGEYLTFPGLAETFTLRPHQRAAVARMIGEPTTGLFHQVGAGKTLEMIAGATELRRMGLVRKPAVIVPNHMLEQFTREWLQAYPQANILAASSKDLTGERRRMFIAKAAMNDWDGIIMTQGAFKSIGVSAEYEAQYIDTEISTLKDYLATAEQENGSTVKQIEKKILAAEEKQKKKLEIARDAKSGLTFEETGIDYLLVDEAHMYKNLMTVSSIPDAQIEGSQQANDLHMKLSYLRDTYGPRVATMATATPIANSITEAHVMQRYLRPDLIEKAGVSHFDAWAATFGQQVTAVETSVTGQFKVKTRFAKFQNIPELLRMWHVFADVKTAQDLNLPIPQIARRDSDGKREVENVVLEPTSELLGYMADIVERTDAVADRRVDPTEDNMLTITSDGRKAALDLRLVDGQARASGPVKLDAVSQKILTHWNATRDREFLDETGAPSPVRGSMQMVFCDLGTPSDTRWNVYDELKQKLVAGGMPPGAVRFIHEARNDAEKAALFANGRAGHIAVLIGSTQKMGMGTNVQDRISALHHIDCPWRPADIEQRDGRALRQGNQNDEVEMYRYIVERSFDGYNWQTIARKAEFIAQIMTGRIDAREIEDIGDTALSAQESRALGTGNPLLLEKAQAESTLQTLRRQETAHTRAQRALTNTISTAQHDITTLECDLAALGAARERTVDVSGDKFAITIGDATFTSRADAAAAVTAYLAQHHRYANTATTMGTIGGHPIAVRAAFDHYGGSTQNVVTFGLADVPRSEHRIPFNEAIRADGIGLIRQLENKTTAIPANITRTEADLDTAQRNLAHAQATLGKPFARQHDLDAAYAAVQEINTKLDAQVAAEAEPAQPSATKTPRPDGDRPALSPAIAASFPHAPNHGRPRTPQTATKARTGSGPDRDRNGQGR